MKKQTFIVFFPKPRDFLLLLCVLWGTSCIRDKNPFDGNGDNHQTIPSTMPQTDIPWPSLANSPWPMLYHDPQLTCRSPYRGPQLGELEWAANPIDWETTSGIAIGKDGTIYYLCRNYLIALNPDSSEKWRFDCVRNDSPTPLIGADNTIYVPSSDGYLYAINLDGTLKWKYNVGSKIPNSATIGLDGTLYFVAEGNFTLYAISNNGTFVWSLYRDSGFQSICPAFSPDGTTLYVGGWDSSLYAISTSGEVLWKLDLNGIFAFGPLVDSQGNIYVMPRGSQVDTDSPVKPLELISINPDGTIRWKYQYAEWGLESGGLTMDKNGYIYFSDDMNHRIISLDYAGKLRWELPYAGQYAVSSAVVCDNEGTIYFCTIDKQNAVVAVTSSGEIKWAASFNVEKVGFPEYSPAIGNNERLYRNGSSWGRWIFCVK